MTDLDRPCSKCKGQGYISKRIAPNEWEAVPCTCAAAPLAGLRDNGLPKHMQGWRFKNSQPYPHVAEALRGTYLVLNSEPFGATFVTLYGNNGSGKTNVLAASCNWATAAGIQAYYTTTHGLLTKLKTLFGAATEYNAFWDWLISVPVLALDELTRYQETAWSLPVIESLIDSRYRPGKCVTLLAFNGLLSAQSVGPYLYSRFTDALNSRHYLVQGVDLRQVAANRLTDV